MFIRVKKIGKYKYGYVVENKWTGRGARQKTIAYLGRVFSLEALDLNALFRIELEEELPNKDFKKGLEMLLQRLLYFLGFQKRGNVFVKDGFVVSKGGVRKGRRRCVIEIHGGFLCDFTLSQLFSLAYEGNSIREWGLTLATAISLSGIPISKKEFVALSARAISEYEIKLEKEGIKDFYY